ncbi:MAG: glutamate synthase [Clostridia bacterium]|nr:glutamate synthase [Clostridia bacterium]
MIKIDAKNLIFDALNEKIRNSEDDFEISNCLGQRFIGAGLSDKNLTIKGTPGNALGAYLNGGRIDVFGNAQDAVGDTMNDGKIIIHGNIGDCAGYAMRGGKIFVKGNAGYRAGIHMKAYKDKIPALVIGGSAGSFLGEYQAGGVIIVLGLNTDKNIVGNFPCTGMHGGKMILRSNCKNVIFPKNVRVSPAEKEDLAEIFPYIKEFCDNFGFDANEILNAEFTVITPDSNNPYKQMYVGN